MRNYLRLVGDCEGALDAGRRARALSATLGNHTVGIRATYQTALVCRQLGDHDRAIAEFQAAVDALSGELLYERFGEPSVLSVHARAWLATVLAEVGRFTEAMASGQKAVEIAEIAGNAYSHTRNPKVARACAYILLCASMNPPGIGRRRKRYEELGSGSELSGRLRLRKPEMGKSR